MDVKDKITKENEILEDEKNLNKEQNLEKESLQTFIPVENKKRSAKSIFSLILGIFIIILLITFSIFTVYNMFNTNIISGVHIKGIDVSNMSASDARYQLDNYINQTLPEEITLKHGDFETTLSLSQIEVSFDTKNAANSAYKVGRQGNVFQNNLYVLSTMFGNINIEPVLKIDEEQLTKNLEDISSRIAWWCNSK